ncbi:hypothetical protein HAX54_002830 [Datura stramonium]|uniref:F-box domain-containing protein n=1 Tax=Datura stramonium TaxID=4076 RepID=A0ABS8T4F6_DATST|nr:hypothetical protein [Datura stramonium]
MEDLPNDILSTVFFKLELVDLHSVMLTCRRFHELIQDPMFVQAHNNYQTLLPSGMLLYTISLRDGTQRIRLFGDDYAEIALKGYPYPRVRINGFPYMCVLKGIVCAYKEELWLWNPALVTKIHIPTDGSGSGTTGLAWYNGELLVIKIAQIFSTANNTWTTIQNNTVLHTTTGCCDMIYKNMPYFSAIRNGKPVVVSFLAGLNQFRTLALPDEVSLRTTTRLFLNDEGIGLCCLVGSTIDIWSLTVRDKWLWTNKIKVGGISEIIGYLGTGNLVLLIDGDVAVFDTITNRVITRFDLDKKEYLFCKAFKFRYSIVRI